MSGGNLNIGGATQGFDISGIEDYIKDIKTDLIEKAKDELDKGKKDVKETVDSVWVGKSADNFKVNLDHDIQIIKDALDEAHDVLISSIWHAANQLKIIDENIVKVRGE